ILSRSPGVRSAMRRAASAELWLDDADSVATHLRVWDTLRESAVYGADAQRVIGRARQAL
ncbi:hypothetical protein AB0D15_40470, partial [Streptomyces sp. NPDC048551]